MKEYYFYLDSTPSHSYMKWQYKYPQRAYPYAGLIEENLRRHGGGPEFELLDTGIFDDDRYFDIVVEYGKTSPEEIVARVTVHNRGPEDAPLQVLPHLWFRNTWAWSEQAGPDLIVGVRVAGDEGVESGIDLPQAQEIARRLETTGKVHYLSVIAGTNLDRFQRVAHWPATPAPHGLFVHLAEGIKGAVGIPVVALFGPTREHETAPLLTVGGRSEVLVNPVWCRPCMLRECPLDHQCMRGVGVDAVLTSARRTL